MRLKEEYVVANCCRPAPDDEIVGYYSHNNIIKVHQLDCPNLAKAEQSRLMTLKWDDIITGGEFQPENDYDKLDKTDFTILNHHRAYGFDYTLKVAAMLNLDKQIVFDRHNKLRGMGLLERVEPRMIQYRKNIVKGKWIKHRNHTYYDLTARGSDYLSYHDRQGGA
jgi:hypothetical protein